MPSLKGAFRKGALAAFNAAGDIKETVTYRSKANRNPTYTPSSNTVSDSYSDYDVLMVFGSFKSREIDGQTVLSTDQWGMCRYEELYDSGITPKINDTIVRSSTTWEIIDIMNLADVVYKFHLRKP